MPDQLWKIFQKHLPAVDFCSLRYVATNTETMRVSSESLEDYQICQDAGIYISVIHNGGAGYSATSRLDSEGVRLALEQACNWAELSRQRTAVDYKKISLPQPDGTYQSPEKQPWEDVPLGEKITLLADITKSMDIGGRIVGRFAGVERVKQQSVMMYSNGHRCDQTRQWLIPSIYVLANKNGETQTRSWGGSALGGQTRLGGFEYLEDKKEEVGQRLAEESLQLLSAPDCPSQCGSLLVMPDQMAIQIHESVGHPLELDRILGDERNMAGTSFVTLDMIGSYAYGSPLLNVSFDPTITEELGSYGWDDDGCKAEKRLLIEKGILKRVLGGQISQARADVPGVSCSRAENWHRPPVDRMANINVEPGETSLEDMISSIENGILVSTNRSWSIDDSRNKFQFGCEWGEIIKNGERAGIVKNPGYRGVSASFWRNLQAVGNRESFEVHGTPYCGKAEPGQVITVGHASPPCLFGDVEIFGGSHA